MDNNFNQLTNASIQPAQTPAPQESSSPTPPPKKSSHRPIIITLCSTLGIVAVIAIIIAVVNLNKNDASDSGPNSSTTTSAELAFDSSNWSYDSSNDVYYQIGVYYTSKPVSSTYETFGVYVPGTYLTCEANTSDTYACEINESASVNGYTAKTAPIVMPVNTAGYSAQSAPTSYSYKTVSSYLEEGIIYLYAGMRGRLSSGGPNKTTESVDFEMGAPWGVTDLKAAVRYVRYNDDKIPGNKDAIFAFGHSGGGAQSSILGASGDSPLYEPYLEEIGAAIYYDDGTKISDTIAGVNAWCPITELEIADAAYEWNMGQYASKNTRADGVWTKDLSNDLAEVFADYINEIGFTNNGTTLTLTETSNGIYTAGSYYDYVKSVIEESLNNYLSDNYSSDSEKSSYVSSLGSWATYENGKAAISSIGDFVNSQKSASKSVGAFDDLSRSQAENGVFADSDNNGLHFDDRLAELIYNNNYNTDEDYASAFQADLMNIDSLGHSQKYRVLAYTPTFFLTNYYESTDLDNSSTPAKYWRIRTGIQQGDTALTTEINLSLALEANENVESVDFATVWDKGHTEAERTGSATSNFISWIESLTK